MWTSSGRVVDAFFRAARNGDFDALVAVLDSDVSVLRADFGRPRPAALVRGQDAVAGMARGFPGAAAQLAPRQARWAQ